MRHENLLKVVVLACMLFVSGCSEKPAPESLPKGTAKKTVQILLDWQPSAEYYGFFYAQDAGLYSSSGYEVKIAYASGASAVATEVGTGAAVLGTTTSDNLLRQAAKAGAFSGARVLLGYNPSVVVSLRSTGIDSLDALKGKRLGTNPAASVYSQFLTALHRSSVEAAGIKEDPTIQWSGLPQLRSRTVDAILGYTTNIAVDLELVGEDIREVFLADHGINSYGLVLIATGEAGLKNAGLSTEDVKRLFDLTSQGYRDGAASTNVEKTINALRKADPGLSMEKISKAIEKINRLNSTVNYPLGTIDAWVEKRGEVSLSQRETVLKLYR